VLILIFANSRHIFLGGKVMKKVLIVLLIIMTASSVFATGNRQRSGADTTLKVGIWDQN
jgi:hypothetical protein